MDVESIVNLAVGKIGELLVNEAKFLYGVKDEVKSIQRELMMMNSFLIDMDALDDELGDERTRTTAKTIRSIAYEAEDVIETYILKRHLGFFKCLVTTHRVGAKIGDIKTKIAQTMDMLTKYRGEYGFPKAAGKKGLNKNKGWRPASYPHTKEDHVVGINEDISKLVGLLTKNETQIQVLLIVGMGGGGKTTLTRKLYNHQTVKQSCFDTMAWVSISQKWVAHYGLLDILKEISGETMQLDVAQCHQAVVKNIYKYLETRKYLIVLDDVWTKEALEEILPALPFVDNGSKIIVTTRYREVVDDPTLNISIHEPRKLTEEESWELFEKIALNHGQGTVSSKDLEFKDFKALGEEMLKKCKGLPLTVVALAGLLAKKNTLEEWRKVKVAMRSRVIQDGRGTQAYGAVKDMLTLSYNDLSRDLKPCFCYLGLFPEDCKIPVGMLIRMWIAEGFISSNNLHQGEELEDLARKYLDELIGRCVVRVAARNYDGRAKRIEIHDLMRDLCINKAKELDFLDTLYARSSDPADARALTQPRRTAVHSYDDKDADHDVTVPFSDRLAAGADDAVPGSDRQTVDEDHDSSSDEPRPLHTVDDVRYDAPPPTQSQMFGTPGDLGFFSRLLSDQGVMPPAVHTGPPFGLQDPMLHPVGPTVLTPRSQQWADLTGYYPTQGYMPTGAGGPSTSAYYGPDIGYEGMPESSSHGERRFSTSADVLYPPQGGPDLLPVPPLRRSRTSRTGGQGSRAVRGRHRVQDRVDHAQVQDEDGDADIEGIVAEEGVVVQEVDARAAARAARQAARRQDPDIAEPGPDGYLGGPFDPTVLVDYQCLPTTVPPQPPVALPEAVFQVDQLQGVLADLRARFERGEQLTPEERALILRHWPR